ncbi:DNA translocase FtsK [Ureibacillus manganicus]|uniref:FtsK domain-containing protein n=1 Tax=Ureibacillus manganicus DSM 26584 TaxID=1384049 RepID=A0A0A3HQT5_9BACL|nr:DNA translocase FtsK [Ureibacillus manganicus]KGR73590.1 hypothetical protein CD29_19480 [Ureibacillus manganicus DSM 26584]
MSWFKKRFNRLFNDETEYVEEDVQYNDNDLIQESPDESNKQRSFRFPMIADDELDHFKHDNKHISNDKINRAYESENYNHVQNNNHNHVQSNIVYDVEVSGIRELLEQRRNGKGKNVRKHSVEKKQPIKQKTLSNDYQKTSKQKKEIEKEETQTIIRSRFVPTQVPSPVHGFKKPSPINQLLDKKIEQKNDSISNLQSIKIAKEESELAQIEVASTVISDNELNMSTIQTKPDPFISKDLLNNTNEHEYEDTNSQLLVQQLATQELLINDTFVENNENIFDDEAQNFESSNIDDFTDDIYEDEDIYEEVVEDFNIELDAEEDIEDLNTDFNEESEEIDDLVGADPEEDSESEEFVDSTNHQLFDESNANDYKDEILGDTLNKVEEKQNIHNDADENNKISSGSKLPFNVLMLKSDKEKLKLKETLFFGTVPTPIQHKANPVNQTLSEEKELPQEDEKETSPVYQEYEKPTFDFLIPPEGKTEDIEWMESQADNLVESLSHFQVSAQVESIVQGPAVTQFEITVGHGTKVSKIKNLSDDLKLALAAKDIRIQAPIPGKSSIGIEIPNRISRAVRLSEVIRTDTFTSSDSPLEAALGLDLTGKPITIDLRKMPHGLIAGATGSGKSVCINSILVSLLYKADPHELKLMLIDPKVVELAPFNNIPHLVSPVITDVKTATAALKWAVEEMERRYQLFAHVGVRDLSRYNKQAEKNGNKNKLPYILIVIDELADLMMMAPSDVEESIARIAQKARACGIHLIVATQRPSVDVITGLIKSNIPTRIAFAVSSQIDSRTILDSQGAERLLGRGDMLYLGNGMSAPIRIQGTFVTDDEIEEIIDHVRSQGVPNYMFEHEELLKKAEIVEEYDELFEEVCRFVYEQGTASTSSIQRNYQIGYNRAARMMDLLEKNGFISEQRGSKPREVFITESDLNSMFN